MPKKFYCTNQDQTVHCIDPKTYPKYQLQET